jgi:hypothetical protein
MLGKTADKLLRGTLLVNSKVAAVVGAALFLAAGPAAELFGLTVRFGFGTALAVIFAAGISQVLFAIGIGQSDEEGAVDDRVPKVALAINATWALGLAALLIAPPHLPVAGQLLLGIAAAVAAGFAALEGYAIWSSRPANRSWV